MELGSLEVSHFKNLIGRKFQFSAINAIYGRNGIGKTNLLDAIYYLCLTKSFFGLSDAQLATFEHDYFYLKGNFIGLDEKIEILAAWQQGKKVIRENGSPYQRLSDHIGKFPVVMISPTDTLLITDGNDIRKKLVDGLISQCHNDYLVALLAYNRILNQRNAYLKSRYELRSIDIGLLATFTLQLKPYVEIIIAYRKSIIDDWQQWLHTHYRSISQNEAEVASIEYKADSHDIEEWLLAMQRNEAIDVANATTLTGPHKDKFSFTLNGQSLRRFASQGQQKSFIIALKLAQHSYVKLKTGVKPILLLDDVFEKLDQHRLTYLLNLVQDGEFGQIFVTDTHQQRLEAGLGVATDQLQYIHFE
jgi:DNA replication and repair protein RecF